MLGAKRRLMVAWRSFKRNLFGDAAVQIGNAVYIIDVHGGVKRRLGGADDGLEPLPPSEQLIDHIRNARITQNTRPDSESASGGETNPKKNPAVDIQDDQAL